MTTALKIVQAAVPNADDELCDYILWSHTPFPCGKVSARMLYKAASRFRRAIKNKIRLCDWCKNKAQVDTYLCARCEAGLKSIRDQDNEATD